MKSQWMRAAAAIPADDELHNATRSHLLSLPNTALHTITRTAGKDTRLVCRQLRAAYPPASLRWPTPPRGAVSIHGTENDRPQQELADLLQTHGCIGQLTSLTVYHRDPLQPFVFATIAARLPALRSLSCPWPEGPPPADQPPPALAALTALKLHNAYDDHHIYNAGSPAALQRYQHTMQAVAQLPLLLPRLQALDITFMEFPLPDASFTSAMQQLGNRLTRLRLRLPYLSGPKDLAPLTAGIAALSGSLQHLDMDYDSMCGLSLRDPVAALTRLTCLELSGDPFWEQGSVSGLPPCHLLRSLRRLDLDAYHLTEDDEVAGLAAWLAEGQASTSLQELRLPWLGADGSSANVPEHPTPMLEACWNFSGLTSLEFRATSPRGFPDWPVSGWPAAVGRLTGLRWLSVKMAVEESSSTSAWASLSHVTSLELTLSVVDCNVSAAEAAPQAALQAGLGQLVALQRFAFGMSFPEGWDPYFDLDLLRLRVLRALAALPQLEILDFSAAWPWYYGDHSDGDYHNDFSEELRAFLKGAAGHSLRQVVLPKSCPKAAVQRVRRVLPRITVEFDGTEPDAPW